MGNRDEALRAIHESDQERFERETQEVYEDLLGILEELRVSGGDPLGHLMQRESHYRRPEELAERLSGEQIAELVRTATEDPRERFEALQDFAKVFVDRAMLCVIDHSSRSATRLKTAFDLQARAVEELVR